MPDCQATPSEPALEASCFVEPWPLQNPHQLAVPPPPHTVRRPLHRPLAAPFPSRAHHPILIKHAELMLHKSPPQGINIIPLISPSPLS